jgi:hypothetical protein
MMQSVQRVTGHDSSAHAAQTIAKIVEVTQLKLLISVEQHAYLYSFALLRRARHINHSSNIFEADYQLAHNVVNL